MANHKERRIGFMQNSVLGRGNYSEEDSLF